MEKNETKGWVYIIINEAMPGLIKVGYSLRDPKIRAQELDNTGSPFSYEVAYEGLVMNPAEIESITHQQLEKLRAGKEWFRCSIKEAIDNIKDAADEVLFENTYVNLEIHEENHRPERNNEETEIDDAFYSSALEQVIKDEMRIWKCSYDEAEYRIHEKVVAYLEENKGSFPSYITPLDYKNLMYTVESKCKELDNIDYIDAGYDYESNKSGTRSGIHALTQNTPIPDFRDFDEIEDD